MEDTLGVAVFAAIAAVNPVLILVLMEDTLGEEYESDGITMSGLNPCFNGRYSRSEQDAGVAKQNAVLILVLMEDTLGGMRLIKRKLFRTRS